MDILWLVAGGVLFAASFGLIYFFGRLRTED